MAVFCLKQNTSQHYGVCLSEKGGRFYSVLVSVVWGVAAGLSSEVGVFGWVGWVGFGDATACAVYVL